MQQRNLSGAKIERVAGVDQTPRQPCLFHLKRNVAKWLKKLDLSKEEEERIKRLLSLPTVEAGEKIYSWYEEADLSL
jgi:hypothetical protein